MVKRLVSKEEYIKKQKKNQRVLGVVLIIIMFGSVFGVIVGSFNPGSNSQQDYTTTYNGLEFTYDGQYFRLNLGEVYFYFTEAPSSYNNLDYSMDLTKNLASFYGSTLYIDSANYMVTNELANNFQGYAQRIQLACLENSTCTDEVLPIKDCSDNLIVVRESSINKVYEEDNCIFIEGTNADLLKLTDLTILKLLGVN